MVITMNETKEISQSDQNSLSAGFFGQFGGQFVPPELLQTVQEVDTAWKKFRHDPESVSYTHLTLPTIYSV